MKRILEELQRRNVLRVAVLYVLGAWLTLQVADVLFDLLDVPAWSGKLVLVILALGLPVVLVFAWVFEITADGVKRESQLDRSRPPTADTGRKLNIATGVLAALALLLIAGQGLVPALRPGARATSHTAAEASIAVLPFVDMSPEGDQEYFSDGLSEELLNLLAKIPELKVISRTSSFQFKGRNEDVRAIGRQLGVAHVLEGSVRKSADRVRITAQLIDTEDGSHHWSETYDRDLHDIFAVQDEIAGEVVKALQVTMLGVQPAARTGPSDPEAYRLLLQARHFNDQRTSASLARAIATVDSALALDPRYAVAWADLSRFTTNLMADGEVPLAAGAERARAAAERALALDPELPEALVALAGIELDYEWRWQAAEQHIRRAEALDPGNYVVLLERVRLDRTLGRFDAAVAVARRMVERNPLQAGAFLHLALVLDRADSLAAAEAAARKALELSPGMYAGQRLLALVLLHQGRLEEALAAARAEPDEFWRVTVLAVVYAALGDRAQSDAALRELEQRWGAEGAYQVAEVYAYRGEIDRAFHWLDRAYRQRDGGLTEILGNPLLKNLEADPRYGALLRRLDLPARGRT